MSEPSPPTTPPPIRLFVDADACPVKEETYRVGSRYGLKCYVVANSFLQTPLSPLIERVVVDAGPDVADAWIAERCGPRDIVITNDIPLAELCLKAGSQVLKPNGQAFTPDSIGASLAQRAIMEHIRSTGGITGGPPPFDRNDRSRFLQALDLAVQKARKRTGT